MYNIDAFLKLHNDLLNVPKDIISEATIQNKWFTVPFIENSLSAISNDMLDKTKLEKWLSSYPSKEISGKKIALIMAGNIPLVGFADLLAVLILKGTAYFKTSSKDCVLMNWVINKLKEYGCKIEPYNSNYEYDAVIATGGDIASKIFAKKYKNIPALIRGSRTSIAVIDRTLASRQLEGLWHDVFDYGGLGCRNVSHLLIRRNIGLDSIVESWKKYKAPLTCFKNSYLQKKAILTINNTSFIDGGYFLLQETLNSGVASLGEITYSFYDTYEEKDDFINQRKETLQCIVGDGQIEYGNTQRPSLNEWADGIDTINFLQNL
ncbi:MAG: hypothetical protein IMY73_03550 [Bacteroidetes bacterium]|nr:hypothetical protein [Bacteroidota bacterium]